MATPARTPQRQAALRFALATVGWLACIYGWGSLLTFDPADAPSTTVWPHNDPPQNWCGSVGAYMAYYAYTYIGWGAIPLLLLINAAVIAWSRGLELGDTLLRLIGAALVVTATAAGAESLLANADGYLVTGPGGVLGFVVARWLLDTVQWLTWPVLAAGAVVGFALAADEMVLALLRGLQWAGERSGPALARGGEALAGAGAAVATGVASGVASVTRLGGNGTAKGPKPAAALGKAQRLEQTRRALEEIDGDEIDDAPPRGRKRPTRPVDLEADEEEADETRADTEETDEEEAEEEIDDEEEEVEEEEEAEEGEVDEEEGEEEADEEDEHEVVAAAAAKAPPKPVGPAVRELGPRPTPPPPRQLLLPRSREDEPYQLPPVNLLERPIAVDRAAIEQACREKAFTLERTLNEFRLEVQVVAIDTGPVITVFELKLAPGIKVSQIQSLSNDMARALKAPAVRVVAPLPGKNTIGIEVPNIDKEKVRLRDVLELSAARLDNMAIPLFLGKDALGQPLVTDLTRMPHLLIAGTTGSGKSVCIGSIITSVLMTRTPSEVQMVLIDPKVVELSMYKDVPHLMCPIVTDNAKAESILDWASTKMDERYELFAEAGVKDIRGYNKLGAAGLRERLNIATDEELARIPITLPYIVIVVDELADLMMTSPKEVEFYLARIAQKSRAVGIHLIVATQRPQANVVTGLIKANLPCRISFRVSSRLDSRIVLDQNGGEVLMGQGDMLFLPPGSAKLVRAQGTFVDDDELRAVVKHCKEQQAQNFHPELVKLPGAGGGDAGERDELFDDAVDTILETRRGSVSLLQRRFNIGYSRASRLIDQMYAAGLVGEYKGSQAREVLVTKEEWAAIRDQRNREEAAEVDEIPPA